MQQGLVKQEKYELPEKISIHMEEKTVSPSIARSTRPNAQRRLSQAHHSDAASHTIAGQRALQKNDKLVAGKPLVPDISAKEP